MAAGVVHTVSVKHVEVLADSRSMAAFSTLRRVALVQPATHGLVVATDSWRPAALLAGLHSAACGILQARLCTFVAPALPGVLSRGATSGVLVRVGCRRTHVSPVAHGFHVTQGERTLPWGSFHAEAAVHASLFPDDPAEAAASHTCSDALQRKSAGHSGAQVDGLNVAQDKPSAVAHFMRDGVLAGSVLPPGLLSPQEVSQGMPVHTTAELQLALCLPAEECDAGRLTAAFVSHQLFSRRVLHLLPGSGQGAVEGDTDVCTWRDAQGCITLDPRLASGNVGHSKWMEAAPSLKPEQMKVPGFIVPAIQQAMLLGECSVEADGDAWQRWAEAPLVPAILDAVASASATDHEGMLANVVVVWEDTPMLQFQQLLQTALGQRSQVCQSKTAVARGLAAMITAGLVPEGVGKDLHSVKEGHSADAEYFWPPPPLRSHLSVSAAMTAKDVADRPPLPPKQVEDEALSAMGRGCLGSQGFQEAGGSH